jgi:hypothetical protein
MFLNTFVSCRGAHDKLLTSDRLHSPGGTMIAKYIPGVLIGAVIAGAAFFLIDRSGGDRTLASAESQAMGAKGERLPPASGAKDFPVSGGGQSSEPSKVAEETTSRRNGAAPDAALPPTDQPIYLPRELEHLRAVDVFQRFERRPIDPNWSPHAEIQLSNYFAQHPELVSVYGMPAIHCRATVCLALFIASGYVDHARNYPDPKLAKIGETMFGATDIFRADNREFFNDPVAKQFSDKEGVMGEGRVKDGVATFFWLLPRRTADK